MIEQSPLAKLVGTTLGTYKLEQLLEQRRTSHHAASIYSDYG